MGPMATIGPKVEIGAGTVILSQVSVARGARVGEGCLLHPGARVGERVVPGARCILQPNAVVGPTASASSPPSRAAWNWPRRPG